MPQQVNPQQQPAVSVTVPLPEQVKGTPPADATAAPKPAPVAPQPTPFQQAKSKPSAYFLPHIMDEESNG